MPSKYDFLFSWRKNSRNSTVAPIDPKLRIEDYKGEAAKISESVQAYINLLQLMHDELVKSNPTEAIKGEYLKQRAEVIKKAEDLQINAVLKETALITIKRDVKDDATMQKLDENMVKINQMVDFLASIKPVIQTQRFDDTSPENRIARSSNMLNHVADIAERSRNSLQAKVDKLHRKRKLKM